MKCVAYDETFQREMKDKFRRWTPREKPKDQSRCTTKGKRKRRGAVAAKPDVSDMDEDISDNVDDELVDIKIAPRRLPRVRRPPKRFLAK